MFFNKRKRFNGKVAALLPAFGFDLDDAGSMKTLNALDIAWQQKYNEYEAAIYVAYLVFCGMLNAGEPRAEEVIEKIRFVTTDWLRKDIVREELVTSFSNKAGEWINNSEKVKQTSHEIEEKEELTTNNSHNYGSGTLVHQEIKSVLDTVDTYISQFGDKKPEAITLNPYDWAVMDLSLRQAAGNTGGLHTHSYNDLRINCKSNRCYCHHFLDDPEIREIVKTLNNYLEIMGSRAPSNLPIDATARLKLNNRFEYFFDGAFNLDSKPHLALQIIKVTGQELYKNYSV